MRKSKVYLVKRLGELRFLGWVGGSAWLAEQNRDRSAVGACAQARVGNGACFTHAGVEIRVSPRGPCRSNIMMGMSTE